MWRALKQLGLFYVFLLFFSVSPNDAEIVYKATGEDVVLSLPLVESPIQRVQWKHNGDIAAEMYGKEVQCLLQFKGRCEVNTDSGELTIKGLNLNDSGIYTPEINGKVFNKTQLSVISRVAKPSVKTFYNTEMTSCLLTCEGNTAEAEPITYTWFIDGKHGPSDKVLTITKDSKEYSFRCLMMNPVSNETSESITNPFTEQERDQPVSIPLLVVVIVLVVIVVAVFIYKCIRGRQQRAQYEKLQGDLQEKRQQERARKIQMFS
ncbi:uncharacterized protein LOC121506204 [Cheilinus undulatus]|uniref:uncharacterized protein LOC121506204 n=1 Tax=Cheilinus undulatus TaxID=241271 RepID=UPI001BD28F5F|nr:uncharacterized protein LOC121506204 [Cheilinus undulatus]